MKKCGLKKWNIWSVNVPGAQERIALIADEGWVVTLRHNHFILNGIK
jgi:hypothetical protein